MYQEKLLKKYLEDKCSYQELQQLYQYLQSGQLKEYEGMMEQVWYDLQNYPSLPAADAERIYENILVNIGTDKRSKEAGLWSYYGKVAAAVVLMLTAVISLWYWMAVPSMESVCTGYRQTREIALPDGSTVYLNANSRLRYPQELANVAVREVWLEGEAFFKVNEVKTKHDDTKTLTKKSFVVHTSNLDIEVLGTQFNVRDRRGLTEVVLNEGKVQLTKTIGCEEKLALAPGDKVKVDTLKNLSLTHLEDPELYSSWTDNELYFDANTLAEIAQKLQDNYGIRLTLADTSLADLRFTGSTPANDLEVLLITIQKSFNLKLTKHEKGYLLEKK